MAEGFRFMPLGLVRLRTYRLSTWVSLVQTCVQVLTRARGGCVVKDVKERLTSGCEWCHAPEERARRILWILKKSVSWVETRDWTRRVNFRGSQMPDEFARYGRRTRWEGADEKARIEKIVYLSPYVEEPLNSKVIKNFVPELRSRKCFRVSRFLCSMYIYTNIMNVLHTGMNMYISRIHIWLWYQPTNQSTNQSINHPTNQPTNQTINQLTNQPTNQPTN